MTLAKRSLAAGLILLGLTVSANADVLYDNLSQATAAYDQFTNYTPNMLAGSFNTTGAANLDLTDVIVLMGGGTSSGSSLVVTLHADSGSTTPGTALPGISWTVSDATFATNGMYDFHITGGTTLASSSTYWVSIADSGTAGWAYSSTSGGTPASGVESIANQYSYGGGASSQNGPSSYALQMCAVTGGGTGSCSTPVPPVPDTILATFNTASSTPEPASLAILGAAVIGLGMARRFRKA